jgi:hypothetical protein
MKGIDKLIADDYLITGNGVKSVQKYKDNSYDAARKYYERLSQNVAYQDYLKEQQQTTSKKLLITRESQLKELQDIKGDFESRPSDKIKAIEVQNKMLGLNEPDKIDLTSNGDNILDAMIRNGAKVK